MDLEELRAFLVVVEAGSFFAAADSLGVSRTTLRRRVASLEARAGVALLESTPQGVVLTEAGQVLAKRGASMVEEASALIASVRELGREPSGVLRIVLPVGLPPQMITPFVSMLRSAWPSLLVRSWLSSDPTAESLVDVDIVVHFGERGPKGAWITEPVIRVREWLVAHKDYLARKGKPATLEDLERHDLFMWRAPGSGEVAPLPLVAGGTYAVEPAMTSPDVHVLRHIAIAEQGIVFMPDAKFPDPNLPEGTIVPVLEDVVGRDNVVAISAPAALADVPKIKHLLAHARGFLGPL